MPTFVDRMLPPTPLARRLSAQSILFAVGEGVFLTGSAVFFTKIVGLSAAQVGLGLTIAGVVSFFFSVPLGRAADRVGPKRMWAPVARAEAPTRSTSSRARSGCDPWPSCVRRSTSASRSAP